MKSLHFPWFWASHACHSTEEIMKKEWKSIHFQWFWASHASLFTEKNMNERWKSLHFPMILGFPRFPLHRRNYEKCWEINAFSMILGFPRFPLHKGICWICFKHLGCFFLGRLSRWLTRANVAIPSRDSAKKFAKKLRNDPLRESHFLNAYFLNSWGGVCATFLINRFGEKALGN